MKIMMLEDLEGHDVFEFTYDSCFQKNLYWQKSSIYISDDDFYILYKYANQVIKNYHYYGPQKIYIKEWNIIKELLLKSENDNKDIGKISELLNDIDLWIINDPQKLDFFWIYGI